MEENWLMIEEIYLFGGVAGQTGADDEPDVAWLLAVRPHSTSPLHSKSFPSLRPQNQIKSGLAPVNMMQPE
jgi:hypothetical protein